LKLEKDSVERRCERTLAYFVKSKVLKKRSPGRMGMENPEHLLSSIRQKFLGVPRVGDRLAFLRVAGFAKSSQLARLGQTEKELYFNLIWRKLTFGISRTKIQCTLNTPFHLSEAHTVLLRV
jgi:hypothetical protein